MSKHVLLSVLAAMADKPKEPLFGRPKQARNQCAETCERAKLCAACAGPVTEYKRMPQEEVDEMIEDYVFFGSPKSIVSYIEDACAKRWGVKLGDNQ